MSFVEVYNSIAERQSVYLTSVFECGSVTHFIVPNTSTSWEENIFMHVVLCDSVCCYVFCSVFLKEQIALPLFWI